MGLMTMGGAFLRILVIGLLCVQALPAAEEVVRGARPEWVEPMEVKIPEEVSGENGSVDYLLVDLQRHLEEGVTYQEFVMQIANESGVKENSQLDFDFQPEYETLHLHHITVTRAGEVQDRLAGAEIEVIRREEKMDQQVYDGELTALVILEDIRPGDVLSYAYSLEGSNPVFGERVHSFYRMGYTTSVRLLNRRIVWDPEVRTLRSQLHVSDQQPEVVDVEGGLRELRWRRVDTPREDPEDNMPGWLINMPWLEISDYGDWGGFGKWGYDLYTTDEELPAELREVCDELKAKGGTREELAIGVLRWVQGNVRYLGSFMGEHTHEPYPLEEVCRRRFGDCKDKGMMTVAMLRYLGFDAAPALVNTYRRRGVETYLPGHSAFNHLIVHLDLDGEAYWLDPTVTYQRGPLKTVHTPDYGFAFVLREGERVLRKVERRGWEVDWTHIEERYVVPEMTGGAELHVHTVATGADANRLRRYFAGESREDVEESYRDFYANDFPDIEVLTPLSFKDDEEKNEVEVREHYGIKEFWRELEESEHEIEHEGEVYAGYLDSLLDYPTKETRTQPLAVDTGVQVRQTILVELPEDWDAKKTGEEIKHPAFDFNSTLRVQGSELKMVVTYRSLADSVEVEDLESYREAMDEVSGELTNYVSHWDNPSRDDAAEPEVVAEVESDVTYLWVAVLLGLMLGLMVAVGLYFVNPRVREATVGDYVGLGGWMVLIVIGVLLTPLVILWEASTFFDGALGLDPGNAEDVLEKWEQYYFVGTFLDAFFLPLAVLLAVLMFAKRTSFPWMYIWIFGAMLLGDLVVIAIEGGLDAGIPDWESDRAVDIGRGVLRFVLWSSYMMVSQRVKATFVRRRGEKALPQPPPLPGVVG